MEHLYRRWLWTVVLVLLLAASGFYAAPAARAKGPGPHPGPNPEPNEAIQIEIEKSVSTDGQSWADADKPDDALHIDLGAPVWWKILVHNGGNVDVSLEIHDRLDNVPVTSLNCKSGTVTLPLPDSLQPGEDYVCEYTTGAATVGLHRNETIVTATGDGQSVTKQDSAYYISKQGDETLSEGCGPGFWKNHLTIWPEPYEPGSDYVTAFELTGVNLQLTLLGALERGGGGEAAFARLAVTALLNSVHPDTESGHTAADVIKIVQDTYASGEFAKSMHLLAPGNEDDVCMLSGPAGPKHREGQPGTRTRTHWRQHPEEWPVDELEVGHHHYTKEEALQHMEGDDALVAAAADSGLTTDLFSAAVATKLNIAAGNRDTCVANTVAVSDDWLAAHPVGSTLDTTDPAVPTGTSLYNTLESYNSGDLCAPSVEALNPNLFIPLISNAQ